MTTQGNDDKFGDSTREDHAHSMSTHRTSKSGTSTLLITAGVLMWAAAGALMTVPGFVPQYAWIFRHAAKHGITSGPLVMFGLCLCGLGMIARAVAAPKDEQEESQQRLRFDQLSSDLAQVREGLDASRADLSQVRGATQAALEIAQNEQANATAENRQDAIFRLAASLDQVGARIDQRIQSQQIAMQNMIQELSQSVSATQEYVKELARSRPVSQPTSHMMERAIEMKNAHSQERGANTMERMSHGSGMGSGSEVSLGLLDTLDDYGAMHGKAPSLRSQSIVGDGQRARDISEMDGPSAPLPRDGAGMNSEQAGWSTMRTANGGHESHPAEGGHEISTRDKLELLRSLMDDVRVREALGALTGTEG